MYDLGIEDPVAWAGAHAKVLSHGQEPVFVVKRLFF
jgi:hypothetical protein